MSWKFVIPLLLQSSVHRPTDKENSLLSCNELVSLFDVPLIIKCNL